MAGLRRWRKQAKKNVSKAVLTEVTAQWIILLSLRRDSEKPEFLNS